jgi:hypothetical protein
MRLCVPEGLPARGSTGVDMARMKIECFATVARRGSSLHDRLPRTCRHARGYRWDERRTWSRLAC